MKFDLFPTNTVEVQGPAIPTEGHLSSDAGEEESQYEAGGEGHVLFWMICND